MDSTVDDHSRTIIHLDLDCFYAQVEMIKNPQLKSRPLGIQQKNIVVTSNYIAREFGVTKNMLISEAKKLCPDMMLVNGEDLHDYRQYSYKVTSLLQKYTNLVERLGLDENFINVSELITERLKTSERVDVVGNIFGDASDLCDCGCYERLKVGTNIAQEIRDQIKCELELTGCAGVSHNKLLAKLVGSKNKPNQQTVLFPNSAVELMLSLPSVSNIPGIGYKLFEQLTQIGIKSVADLQNSSISQLENLVGSEKFKTIRDLSFGLDQSPVKPSGRPQSIGIEDACKTLSADKEVREKFHQLLKRLLILVAEDGRNPKTIKVTVRKFNKNNVSSTRETRQCNINTKLFNSTDVSKLTEYNLNTIMTVIMRLFNKLVNTNKPYHLTLLGLSFTKFVEKPNSKSALHKFLVNKDIEVQSLTNIESLSENILTPETSPSESFNENLESDIESTAKRLKSSNLFSKKRLLTDSEDCESPSKLRVSELRLNSTRNLKDKDVKCPPDADEVFWELPKDVQQEIWDEFKRNKEKQTVHSNPTKRVKPNSIMNYFVTK